MLEDEMVFYCSMSDRTYINSLLPVSVKGIANIDRPCHYHLIVIKDHVAMCMFNSGCK